MMTESESVALPLGDAALTERIIADVRGIVKRVFLKTVRAARARKKEKRKDAPERAVRRRRSF